MDIPTVKCVHDRNVKQIANHEEADEGGEACESFGILVDDHSANVEEGGRQ